MKPIADLELESAIAQVVDAESRRGAPWWPGNQIAAIARRRWHSFGRRHPIRTASLELRVSDLAKGLHDQFESGVRYTHHAEFEHLAGLLALILDQANARP